MLVLGYRPPTRSLLYSRRPGCSVNKMDGSNNGRSSDDLHQRNTPPGDDEGSEMMMMDESKLLEEANK